jgi:hypothetical protein
LDGIVTLFKTNRDALKELLLERNIDVDEPQLHKTPPIEESPVEGIESDADDNELIAEEGTRRSKRISRNSSVPPAKDESNDPLYGSGTFRKLFKVFVAYFNFGVLTEDMVVECPCCFKSVLNKDINRHLNTDCQDYIHTPKPKNTAKVSSVFPSVAPRKKETRKPKASVAYDTMKEIQLRKLLKVLLCCSYTSKFIRPNLRCRMKGYDILEIKH